MFGEDTEANAEFTLIEPGSYDATLDNVDMDDSGNHPYVGLTFTMVEGNRKLWKRLYCSDGTAKKFLPWQASVLGIKTELDTANLDSHVATARKMMELLGSKIGCAYSLDVKITDGQDGRQYNDLVITSAAVTGASATVTVAAPKSDTSEPLPF